MDTANSITQLARLPNLKGHGYPASLNLVSAIEGALRGLAPREVDHAYINRGPQPATALVVYQPAPGPKDRARVEEQNQASGYREHHPSRCAKGGSAGPVGDFFSA